MDYSYFPFFDDYLRSRKLRFGVVLNHQEIHQEMRFELWLMGQNAQVQAKYWQLLKGTQWNKGRVTMPQYAILEIVTVSHPQFNDLDSLKTEIGQKTVHTTANNMTLFARCR